MPAEVVDDPLSVSAVFGDGTRSVLRLEYLPCRRLVADLAVGLAGRVHPHGPVNTAKTLQHYRSAIRALTRFLGSGYAGGAAELTRASLVEFCLGTSRAHETSVRTLLRSFDECTGRLRPQVGESLAGQPHQRPVRRRDQQQLRPYSDTEWDRLRECCWRIADEARAARRSALVSVAAGADPGVAGWSPENTLWLLARRGPIGMKTLAREGVSVRAFDRGVFPAAKGQLFPTISVALAYRLLLGMTSGIVPDGLNDLGLGDITWAGDRSVVLDYIKGRSGPQSLLLPTPAVRVLARWLEHSASLRQFASPEVADDLWLVIPTGGASGMRPRFNGYTVMRWAAEHGLRDDAGYPLAVHKHRLRTTFENRRDKRAWTGRATIDPNHTAAVEGDHYLSRPTPAQQDALDAVIADAQADLVRKAWTPRVWTEQDLTTAAHGLPAAAAGTADLDRAADWDPAVLEELVGGQRDVFTAACADQLSGLHGPAGRPCPARPWVCLLCPLAVFAPRHAPNLLRLKAFFARQFRQLPLPQFLAVFGPYAHRLDQDILPRFAPAVLTEAGRDVRDVDDELPLRPEEHTC